MIDMNKGYASFVKAQMKMWKQIVYDKILNFH
jgi:hypothetical protein